jgi:cytochrome P450/NADPH-cytochrome P450 reductase
LVTLGISRVIVSSHELADELFNEERFRKAVIGGVRQVRNGVEDGLFTADYPGEENWAVAHRVLVPAFGPLSIRGMFDGELAPIQIVDDPLFSSISFLIY